MSTNMDPHAVAVGPDSVSPSAPSPSLSPASGATPIKTEPSDGKPAGPNSARRPPRKSTLTQQQKNQKRQRATQDQLATLEMEFSKNPTPTADVRDRIADEINMTQRSVQIWFQNRRAKIKLMAKKHLENGEDLDSIPESMRQYLAMQAIESGKGLAGGFLGRSGLLPCGNGMLMGGDPTGQSKVLIQHLTCRALSIGTWTRVGQNMMDLIVFYSPEKCTMTYYINNEQAGYKIEYPFAYIKNICLENNEGDPSKPAGIVIELNHPPHFFMDSSANAQGFYQVADFTEDMQASRCLVHRLGGSPKVLSGQLAKLVSLESFMNRHIQQQPSMFESHALSASAPVSPTARPSSQPNFQQPHVGMYQESWGAPPNAPPPSGMRGPGHKRQRSRSVPMPVDFSMFQAPMPSFYIQQPSEAAPQQGSPHIFAPAPQQPTSAPGSNLRIDTQAGFGLDMRQYPMSATTASPSEFSSPNFFAQGSESTPLPVNTPYSGTFLSPMPNPSNLVPPSVSPLPFNGPTEPSIVEQSPPMTMAGRPASADAYQLNDGSCAVSDDGANLGDMYSKQNMNIPMHSHSPAHFDHQHPETDMSHLVQFDSADHASVSPEAMTQGTSQSGMHAVTPQTAQ